MLDGEERELRKYFDYIIKHALNRKFRSFFYKTRAHTLICLLLGSSKANDAGYSYEEICNLIPSGLASRTTILTSLQEGVYLKYFFKKEDSRDKRRQFYKLNISQKSRIISWAKDMENIFEKDYQNFK